MDFIMTRLSNVKLAGRTFVEGVKLSADFLKENGLRGLFRGIIQDLFFERSFKSWIYGLILGVSPLAIELYYNHRVSDWLGMIASITGILCVLLVSEGRKINFLFGFINSLIYLYLAFGRGFYGEVLTTLYFAVMQPIGLFIWLAKDREDKKENEVNSDFVAHKLTFWGNVKYALICIVWWLVFGFIYASIGSKRPFRDSVTDGTNGVGQLLMTGVYREQWIYWILTNLFSIYLWFGSSIQIQGMYWVYLVNSIVGWYVWSKQAKK